MPRDIENGNEASESSPLIAGQSRNNRGFANKLNNYSRSFLRTFWLVLASNYVNILLVFVPLGIIAGEVGWSPAAIFTLNFMAIIPLAALLSFATEELAVHVGQTLGGLLNATFGNAVEVIVSIVALQKKQIRVVQASMLGSILSNMLLVLGCCFFFGGLRYKEQTFNSTVASTMSSLMAVATASLIIPAALYSTMSKPNTNFELVLQLSRGTSVVLLILYVLYLFFQLKTHTELFEDQSGQEEEEEEAQLSVYSAGAVLVFVTVLVSYCADYLVGSIDEIVKSTPLSKTFIGLILIPIVGNAAEHVTAVVVAAKNKMDLAIGVAIGSSMQIALFVTPFLVLLGWAMDREMSLYFQTFETIVFFISVLVTNYLIQDGKSNYLEGVMLLGIYTIVAISFYVYPDTDVAGVVPGP